MTTKNQIIALFDLENFVRIAKKLNSAETFILINEIHTLSMASLMVFKPSIAKNIGDSTMFILNDDEPDRLVQELFFLKKKIEQYLFGKGFNNKASFSCHFGEVTFGKIGIPPYESLDAFGEAINTTFVMNGTPFRGRFNISPQLFRKLGSETRKMFHKYTPQIVYIAE